MRLKDCWVMPSGEHWWHDYRCDLCGVSGGPLLERAVSKASTVLPARAVDRASTEHGVRRGIDLHMEEAMLETLGRQMTRKEQRWLHEQYGTGETNLIMRGDLMGTTQPADMLVTRDQLRLGHIR